MARFSFLPCVVVSAILVPVALFAADLAPIGTPEVQLPTAARAALALPIPEISVDGASLSRVVDFLRTSSGANIVVDWKILEAAGVSKDTPVTLQVRNLSLRKMLQLALDQASPSTALVFTVDQNVIEVTTQDDADTHMVTRVYDVNELIFPDQPDVAPPDLDLNAVSQQASASGGGGGGTSIFTTNSVSPSSSTVSAETRGQALATIIRTIVRPNIWRDNGGTASIQFLMGQLIVTAPLSVQEAIAGPERAEKPDRYGM